MNVALLTHFWDEHISSLAPRKTDCQCSVCFGIHPDREHMFLCCYQHRKKDVPEECRWRQLISFSFPLACCIVSMKVWVLSCLSIQPLDNNHERLRKLGKQKYMYFNWRIFTAVNNLSKRKFRELLPEWMTPWSSGTNNDLAEPPGFPHRQRVLHCSADYHVCHGAVKNHAALIESIDVIWGWKLW